MSKTVVSEPFGLVEVAFVHVDPYEPDAAGWKLGEHVASFAGDAPQTFLRRWLYVFQRVHESTELFAEYYADDTGTFWALGGDVARAAELPERPSPASTGSDRLSVPIEVHGQRAYTWFLASSVRLSPTALQALEQDRPGFCRELHLADLGGRTGDSFTSGPRVEADGSTGTEPFVKVVDPVAIAHALTTHYEWAANDVVAWVSTYPGQSAAARAKVQKREARYLIAKMLLKVISDDPKDDLDLLDDLAETQGVDHDVNPTYLLKNEAHAYELERDRRLRVRDERSVALIRWLKTSAMRALERSHREYPNTDQYHAGEWLAHGARWLPRLLESAPGKTYLTELLSEPRSMINQFVLPQETPPTEVFGVARKQAHAVFALWEAVAPVVEKLEQSTRKVAMYKSINLLYAENLFLSRQSQVKVHVTFRPANPAKGVHFSYLHVNLSDEAEKVLKGTNVNIKRVGQALEIVNLALAIDGFADAMDSEDPDWRERGIGFANLLGSLADLGGAFHAQILEVLGRAAGRSAAALAAFGAVMDVICASDAALTAYQTDDYDHMVGHGIVAAGSTLSAIGAFILLGAAGSSPAPPVAGALAIVGAVVTAAGWVWAILSKDSDLETFVAHCEYGRAFGSGSAAPKWAGGPFSAWKTAPDGPQRQLIALHHLLAAFALRYAYFAGVTIHPSMMSGRSTFTIEFEFVYRLAGPGDPTRKQTPRYVVDWNQREVTHVSAGVVVSDEVATFGADGDGRAFVTIIHPMAKDTYPGHERPVPQVDLNDHDWEGGERPSKLDHHYLPRFAPISRADVRVQLDLRGDGTLLVPAQPKRMHLFAASVSDGSRGRQNVEVVSSKDE